MTARRIKMPGAVSRPGANHQFQFQEILDSRRGSNNNSLRGRRYLPEDQVSAHIAKGRRIRVLANWSPSFSGHDLYYRSRRQPTPAFAVLVEALRYRR
jgi:hypothetical protein